MIPDIDIWRSANELIKRYGDTADVEAEARTDDYETKGDRDGQHAWLEIQKAIDALQEVRTAETKDHVRIKPDNVA